MEYATGIFIPEAAQLPIGTAGVTGKYRFQMRWLLLGNGQLFRPKTGYTYHPDIAIAPGLLCNPLDKVITIPGTGTATLRFAYVSGMANNMHVAAGYEVPRVSAF